MYQSLQSQKRRLRPRGTPAVADDGGDMDELDCVRTPLHQQEGLPLSHTTTDLEASLSLRSTQHRNRRSSRRKREMAKNGCQGSVFASLAVFALFFCVAVNIMIAPRFDQHGAIWNHQDPTSLVHRNEDAGKRNLAATAPHIQRPLPPLEIPLPVPPNKLSVVLMNFSRPRMIQESALMKTLLEHPSVDEILLLHANPKTAFVHPHPKVVNIDAAHQNDEIGLSLRFHFCQMAKNKWVLHVDDDMEFSASVLNELLIEYNRNPKRIVGRFGRNLQEGNSFAGYSSRDTHKDSEVILTKFMVLERHLCEAFFDHADLIWEDIILKKAEGPLWNGEDIFMSLVANHLYDLPPDGKKFNNYAMDWLDVTQASDSYKDYDNGELDISGGMSGYRFWDWHWYQSILRRNRHYTYRGKLWHIAKQRLSESPIQH